MEGTAQVRRSTRCPIARRPPYGGDHAPCARCADSCRDGAHGLVSDVHDDAVSAHPVRTCPGHRTASRNLALDDGMRGSLATRPRGGVHHVPYRADRWRGATCSRADGRSTPVPAAMPPTPGTAVRTYRQAVPHLLHTSSYTYETRFGSGMPSGRWVTVIFSQARRSAATSPSPQYPRSPGHSRSRASKLRHPAMHGRQRPESVASNEEDVVPPMPELMITQSAELTARSFTMRRTTAQRERSAPYAVA